MDLHTNAWVETPRADTLRKFGVQTNGNAPLVPSSIFCYKFKVFEALFSKIEIGYESKVCWKRITSSSWIVTNLLIEFFCRHLLSPCNWGIKFCLRNPLQGSHYSKCPQDGFCFPFSYYFKALSCSKERCEDLLHPFTFMDTWSFSPNISSCKGWFDHSRMYIVIKWK